MIALIISVNILLCVTVIGACTVWLQVLEINNNLALLLCLFTVIIAVIITLIVCEKTVATKKKRTLLFILIPIVLCLSIIVFRNHIIDFLYNITTPIGPGGLPPEMLN